MEQRDDNRAFLHEVVLVGEFVLIALIRPQIGITGADTAAAEVAGRDEIAEVELPQHAFGPQAPLRVRILRPRKQEPGLRIEERAALFGIAALADNGIFSTRAPFKHEVWRYFPRRLPEDFAALLVDGGTG